MSSSKCSYQETLCHLPGLGMSLARSLPAEDYGAH
jgi:hypothetical protein